MMRLIRNDFLKVFCTVGCVVMLFMLIISRMLYDIIMDFLCELYFFFAWAINQYHLMFDVCGLLFLLTIIFTKIEFLFLLLYIYMLTKNFWNKIMIKWNPISKLKAGKTSAQFVLFFWSYCSQLYPQFNFAKLLRKVVHVKLELEINIFELNIYLNLHKTKMTPHIYLTSKA